MNERELFEAALEQTPADRILFLGRENGTGPVKAPDFSCSPRSSSDEPFGGLYTNPSCLI